jgi:cold shock CspA family protein
LISASDGKEYFFHRNALATSADFDRLIGGERVEFEPETCTKGPQAGKVRLLKAAMELTWCCGECPVLSHS